MTEQTPADQLRAAAKLIREKAESPTPGPWVANGAGVGTDWTHQPDAIVVEHCHPDDAAWIALAHPGLAEPIASWLELEAHMWDLRGNHVEGHTFHALAVARSILAISKDET